MSIRGKTDSVVDPSDGRCSEFRKWVWPIFTLGFVGGWAIKPFGDLLLDLSSNGKILKSHKDKCQRKVELAREKCLLDIKVEKVQKEIEIEQARQLALFILKSELHQHDVELKRDLDASYHKLGASLEKVIRDYDKVVLEIKKRGEIHC